MNTTSEGSRFKKLARLCGIASALLMAAWLLPPAIHSYRHLCPVRPDGVTEAGAVPSFARQTGFSCAMCHTNFPELTPMGRRFKLNGYTLTTKPADVSDYSIASSTAAAVRNLVLSYVSPLSMDVQIAYTKYNRALPDTNLQGTNPGSQSQGDQFQYPEQVSLYYAGRVTDNIGTWIQLTYAGQSGTVGIDNNELRYANHSDDRRWVYGTFVNNTPGMSDVYNSQLSAFGIPLFNTGSLNNLGGGTGGGLRGPIFGNMGTNSVGGGEYVFFDDSLYAELSAYHSGPQSGGVVNSSQLGAAGALGSIDGVAPRVRLAYEKDWDQSSVEVGVLGMQTNYLPGGLTVGTGLGYIVNPVTANSPTVDDKYTDGGVDWQYQYIGDDNIVSFIGSVIHERQSNNSALVAPLNGGTGAYSNSIDYLNQTSLTGEYYYRRHFGGIVNWVNTTGTKDVAMNGADGSPDNQYWTFELDYFPWLNTKFILQYDVYTKVNGNQSPFYGFNGASGVNGKASDNNTLVVGLWMGF